MAETHVILGAGAIGSSVARQLAESGESDDVVRVLTRSGSGPALAGVELVAVDAADTEAFVAASAGATRLYNCANPAYHRWPQDWPPIAASLLAAAREHEAVLATVSNLYGYGPVDGELTEDLPLATQGSKGEVRAGMWRDALAEHEAGRIRATEVRGSDYIGDGVQGHLADRVLKPLVAGKAVRVLGSADEPHTWTYRDDMARMLITAAGDERAWGQVWHVPSNPPKTQREVILDYAQALGLAEPKVRTVPGWLIRVSGMFVPMMRELRETEYQFDRPFVMNSEAAQQTFGLAPTPWPEIVDDAVRSYRS
ncbi:MAG: NAD-dependent epimerase/dehydratase family protein [Actinobacteria bacterium]|nr:NAD-dependent epimerase/dehydratase family protein [Actinomycetota bacterium]